ncbi:MAG TPA: DinB family protein [Pyrinomonadaceae bacterium]|nr:DinB family protein [Pyrinomonadaceae bacterium]
MKEAEFQEIVTFLEETPESVRQLAAGLAGTELRWKPSDGEFSALEQVCHLRDLEREGYGVRIEKLLTELEPLLPDFEGGRIARERDYNSQDFERAFEDFSQARARNVRVMKSLTPEELNRRGVLEGAGSITLKKLCLLMLEHDQSHREELRALRERRATRERSDV